MEDAQAWTSDGTSPAEEATPQDTISRRNLIRSGSAVSMAGVGAFALSAHAPASRPTRWAQSSEGGGESVLDRIVSAGTAKIGVDLTFPPIQFRDDNDEPTGFNIEMFKLMLADLEVEPEWVDVPFAEPVQRRGLGADRPEWDRRDDPALARAQRHVRIGSLVRRERGGAAQAWLDHHDQ